MHLIIGSISLRIIPWGKKLLSCVWFFFFFFCRVVAVDIPIPIPIPIPTPIQATRRCCWAVESWKEETLFVGEFRSEKKTCTHTRTHVLTFFFFSRLLKTNRTKRTKCSKRNPCVCWIFTCTNLVNAMDSENCCSSTCCR